MGIDHEPRTHEPGPEGQRHELEAERADRNLTELIRELRVAQTGVQILFAFLISLPFLSGFPEDRTSAVVLTVALLAAAGATVVFIAPVAFHRGSFHQGRKPRVVRVSHVLTNVGLVLLAIAMALATWLFLSVLWSAAMASLVVALLLVAIICLWWALPALAG